MAATCLIHAGPAAGVCSDAWSPIEQGGFPTVELQDVSIADATHGWAVGYDSYDDSPTFAKWDGATWTNATPTNLTATASLRGVAAITPTDVWVVGEYSKPSALTTSPLLLHWNGTRWRYYPAPSGHGMRLEAIWAVATDDIWVAGWERVDGPGVTMVLHWDGASWSRAATPRPTRTSAWLFGISASGPNNAWAVGGIYHRRTHLADPLALHWDGVSWKATPTPAGLPQDPNQSYMDVAAVGANHAWAVGYLNNSERLLLAHWGGAEWKKIRWPDYTGPEDLSGIVAVSGRRMIAVGQNGRHPLILRRTSGTWSEEASPWNRGRFTAIRYREGVGAFAIGSHDTEVILENCGV